MVCGMLDSDCCCPGRPLRGPEPSAACSLLGGDLREGAWVACGVAAGLLAAACCGLPDGPAPAPAVLESEWPVDSQICMVNRS